MRTTATMAAATPATALHIDGVISMRVVAHALTAFHSAISPILWHFARGSAIPSAQHKFDFGIGADGSTAMRSKLYCVVLLSPPNTHTQSYACTHTPSANSTMRLKRKFNRPFVNKSRKVNSVKVLSLILAFNTNLDQLGTQQHQHQQQLRDCTRNRKIDVLQHFPLPSDSIKCTLESSVCVSCAATNIRINRCFILKHTISFFIQLSHSLRSFYFYF